MVLKKMDRTFEQVYQVLNQFTQELFINLPYVCGHALVDLWPKVLPLAACCLSQLPGFESRHGHVRKLPVTWD